MLDVAELVRLKAELLQHGVAPTAEFIRTYGPPYLFKRRAYGNADDLSFLQTGLPQEIILAPGKVVVSATAKITSPWSMDFRDGKYLVIDKRSGREHVIDFPRAPAFYEQTTASGEAVNSLITLYGGGSLGLFAYGNCALVDMKAACHYCSVGPNRSRQDEFAYAMSAQQVREALDVALSDHSCPVVQVMLNGGNFRDVDKSFSHYVDLVEAARLAVDASGRNVELHLIVYPPYKLDLVERLEGLNVDIAMNTEVHDPELFAKYCPGKEELGGQAHLNRGLDKAVSVLGPGHVFSIFVGGLEPLDSLYAGMRQAAERGAIPVINVLHADPETPLAGHPEPKVDEVLAMGEALESIYDEFSFCRSFYEGVGRNSLDHEAHLRLFRQLRDAS
ncbi:radical SAM protein [Micromonospora sp. NPDC093277]|uniref:radical SAM protein n=1 Tax=Micromonospora sp. NPDC093277 TaxID=3364291 RepID=UPI0037FA3483